MRGFVWPACLTARQRRAYNGYMVGEGRTGGAQEMAMRGQGPMHLEQEPVAEAPVRFVTTRCGRTIERSRLRRYPLPVTDDIGEVTCERCLEEVQLSGEAHHR